MFSFLTLDQSTLFYWTLSDAPPKRSSAINEWASAIPAQSKAKFQGHAKSSGSVFAGSSGGPTRPSASSILTDNIRVISHQPLDQVKVKVEPGVLSLSDGGLSDNDEMGGKERETAINSPLKGKKRITSEVT